MASARERKARRAVVPSTVWLLGTVAVSCFYPHLSSSPDWKGEAEGGADANAGTSGSGASGGSIGTDGGQSSGPDAGSDTGGAPDPGPTGEGGEGGAADADVIVATVVDQNGDPFAGVPVIIDDLALVTDAQGRATTPGEGRDSFRVIVVGDESKSINVYEAVTQRAMRFVVTRIDTTGFVMGGVQGDVQTLASEQNLSVYFVDDRSRFFGLRNPTDKSPTVGYEVKATWPAGKRDGTVQAFNWTAGAGGTDSQLFFGTTATSLEPDVFKTKVDVVLNKLTTRALQVKVTVPQDATRSDFLLFGPFSVSNPTPAAGVITYAVPNDPVFDATGATKQFVTTCSTGPLTNPATATVLVPLSKTTLNVSVSCPAAPTLVSPADAAANLPLDTEFTFTSTQTGCRGFNVVVDTTNIVVWTLEDHFSLPDLTPWGVDFSGKTIDWTASTTSPCDSTDALVQAVGGVVPENQPTSFFSRSVHWKATFAP